MAEYQRLVNQVSTASGSDPDAARAAVEITLGVLAQVLDPAGRQRLLAALPATPEFPRPGPAEPLGEDADQRTTAGFLRQVAQHGDLPIPRARQQARLVLAVLAHHDPELTNSLRLPSYVRDLVRSGADRPAVAPGPVAGGGPASRTQDAAVAAVPLADDELRAALRGLPQWSRGPASLSRTVVLPADVLERVLEVVDHEFDPTGLHLGTGPVVHRDGATAATFTVTTPAAHAVTAADIVLAHRLDGLIGRAAATAR
jgi:uncharacterized protein (DUF2267 family)